MNQGTEVRARPRQRGRSGERKTPPRRGQGHQYQCNIGREGEASKTRIVKTGGGAQSGGEGHAEQDFSGLE